MEELNFEIISREEAAKLAAKSPQERIAMMVEMNNAHRAALKASILEEHPHWTDAERHHEFLRRLLGKDAEPYLASIGAKRPAT